MCIKPITVTDGNLSENPAEWLNDNSWETYQANETEDGQQSYTIKLSEGRNIVEIKAGDATSYHVILARGLDVTIDNIYNPGQTPCAGDTVKVTIDNMIPPVFKMSAIYNPQVWTLFVKLMELIIQHHLVNIWLEVVLL